MGSFEALSEYFRTREQLFAARVERQAILYGGGMAGAAVAGLCASFEHANSVRTFTDSRLAFRWLRVTTELVSDLEHLVAAVASPVLVMLRELLEHQASQSVTLAGTARHFGVSIRQLQRCLAHWGTCGVAITHLLHTSCI